MRRCLALAWALLLAVLAGVLLPPTPAKAADASATVRIGSITPVVGATDGSVTIAGTVTNSGTAPLYTVQVMMCREPAAMRSRADLTTMLARDPNSLTCLRITDEGSYVTISREGQSWAPGTTNDFTVTAKLSALSFTTPGVYVLGIQVRAATDRSANYQTFGRARTLLPVTAASVPRTSLTSVVWLTSRPSLLRPGVLADDHLATELSGRLGTLLEEAGSDAVSWAIDPALYREIQTMSQGYRLDNGSEGTGQAVAQRWLATFATLDQTNGYRIPYGNPDLALGSATANAGILDRAIAAGGQVPDLARLPVIVRAPNGRADQTFLDYVARLQPVVVLADTTRGPVALTSDTGMVAATDPDAFAGGPGPDDRTTPLQRRQRLLASSLLSSLAQSGGTVRVVDDADLVALDTATIGPWETRRPLAQLTPASAWTSSLSTGSPAGPLTPAVLPEIEKQSAELAVYGDLIGSSASGSQIAARALAPAVSASWANDEQAIAYAENTTDEYTDLGDGVKIRVAPTVVMTSRTNVFPVTVTNQMPDTVHVRVRFVSQNPQRLSVPESDLIEIGPGESVTVNADPTATANGTVDMVAQVVTASGATVGTPQKFVIEATEAGRVGWVIVIASGLVVVAATGLRIRAVTRSRRNGDSA